MTNLDNGSLALEAAVDALSEELGADIFLYSGPINEVGFGRTIAAVADGKKRDHALLILTTNGGSANAAYRIARLFQKTYDKFTIYPPGVCKSAGTLIALGADRLLMDNFSELGPLDVQLFKRDEIAARKSGLLSKSSFESLADISFELYEHFMLRITLQSDGLVSFKLASELSATMASNLLAPVYAQINPEVVGSDHRDLSVALHYGMRLAKNILGPEVIFQLINDYPSHDFVIDNEEAGKLFEDIEHPPASIYAVTGLLGEAVYVEQESPFVSALDGSDDDGGPKDEPETFDSAGEAAPAEFVDGSTVDDHRRGDWAGNSEERAQACDQARGPADDVANESKGHSAGGGDVGS